MITPPAASTLCRTAAARMRELADRAAHDLAGDVLHCWDTERLGGVDRVIAVRRFPDGTDDHEIVAVPLYDGIADHVAAWSPVPARAVADLLELTVDLIDAAEKSDTPLPSVLSLAVRVAEAFGVSS